MVMSETASLGGRLRKDDETKREAPRVRLKTVALPNEHGGWSLTLEPAVLGLLVAPSLSGLFLALAATSAFLSRHPFKLVAADRRRGRRFPRTRYAEAFFLLYAALALAFALASVTTAVNYSFILPLAAAVPLVVVQLFYDATGHSRALAPELAGSAGLAAVATSIALAAGHPAPLSLALWALLAARVVPSILYVRARLARLHGEESPTLLVVILHVAALALACLFIAYRLAPLVAAFAFLLLLGRAAVGLRAPRGVGSAKRVGVGEIIYGLVTVLALAFRL